MRRQVTALEVTCAQFVGTAQVEFRTSPAYAQPMAVPTRAHRVFFSIGIPALVSAWAQWGLEPRWSFVGLVSGVLLVAMGVASLWSERRNEAASATPTPAEKQRDEASS